MGQGLGCLGARGRPGIDALELVISGLWPRRQGLEERFDRGGHQLGLLDR